MFGHRRTIAVIEAEIALQTAKAAVAEASLQLSQESLQRTGDVKALLNRGDVGGAWAMIAAADAYQEAAVIVLKITERM